MSPTSRRARQYLRLPLALRREPAASLKWCVTVYDYDTARPRQDGQTHRIRVLGAERLLPHTPIGLLRAGFDRRDEVVPGAWADMRGLWRTRFASMLCHRSAVMSGEPYDLWESRRMASKPIAGKVDAWFHTLSARPHESFR